MKKCDIFSLTGVVLFSVSGIWNAVSYFLLGKIVPLIAACAVSLLFLSAAVFIWQNRLSALWFVVGGGGVILFFCSNNVEGACSNLPYLLLPIAAFLVGIPATVLQIVEREKPKKFAFIALSVLSGTMLLFGGTWLVNVLYTALNTGEAKNELWAVPAKFDKRECPQAGRVEKLDYDTKAYATDLRTVQKSAYVYLPYDYDENTQYNILYLLHGTGDREDYWLKKNSFNKTMLDNMIYYKEIEPLIVVTPTWYVESDCQNDLDRLTYSFQEELRNDLLFAVEGRYATYATSVTEEGLRTSRDHRAFAGLSRGSVTTFHSAFNGCLDYFSWFGCYSACRTSEEEFQRGIRSEKFRSLPIHYLYNTSGSFDFMLKEHVLAYRKLIAMDERLTEENTSFDIFPAGYHSMESWHIALYNTLQKFFR